MFTLTLYFPVPDTEILYTWRSLDEAVSGIVQTLARESIGFLYTLVYSQKKEVVVNTRLMTITFTKDDAALDQVRKAMGG